MQSNKRIFFRYVLISTLFSMLIYSSVQAAGPLWSFVPQTPTDIAIMPGNNAQVTYTVYNQTSRERILELKPVAGISQISSCYLPAKGMCTLILNVNGSALEGDVLGGPTMCQLGNYLQCYQPSATNILHIRLITAANQTTLSPLTQNLALSINNPGADPALTGNARSIRIVNTGSLPANNVRVSTSGFPTGTVITHNSCIGTLNVAASCDITITPGSTASPDNNANACTTSPGTEPVPTTVTVSADNAPSTNINVSVLGYGCIYQGGFLFSVDDSTPASGSIGGKVAALTDEEEGPNNAAIFWSMVLNATFADSLTNGLANTNILENPVGQYPAAQKCLNKSSQGFSDWYLPAICELGRYVGIGVDAGCGLTNPNLYSTLYLNNLAGFTQIYYWSSSEYSSNTDNVWFQFFSNGRQNTLVKNNALPVRCVRIFTP
ncbi:hypothetical protein Lmor_2408 [Legionella moravica]|uniref:Transmembrane protein (Fibronectin III domain and Gp5 C-terminal repeat) n=1 Tax=Legionella moravica TaxID=39962 RepID=A0A378JV32_9GAMM|nr:DUF1566 domain-containing protein [Legionella moravica]KTD32470.1 hypothetical protein Lmor_2408 [Legionella moravica]STX62565.1 transmembrane protein (fibronectin III domain and Gp5 C-terminal repeat) [Legionella moravica]